MKRLGIGRRGVGGDAVAGPAAIADHHHHRHVEAQQPAAQRIARFLQAGVLDQDHRLRAAGGEPGGDRAGMPLAADPDEAQRRLGLHQQIEPVGLAVGQPDDVGDPVLLHRREHRFRAQRRRRCLAHRRLRRACPASYDPGKAIGNRRAIPARSCDAQPRRSAVFSRPGGSAISPPPTRAARRMSCRCATRSARRHALHHDRRKAEAPRPCR